MTKSEAKACEVCGRGPGERRPRCLRCAEKPTDARLPSPLPGRYLVVDPGAKSGWAIVEMAPLLSHFDAMAFGECSVWSREPEVVVARARAVGCEALGVEYTAVGPTPAVTGGLGEARGVWKWLWRQHSGDTRAVICEVYPATWRSTIIGGGSRPTEDWKRDAKAHVRRTLNQEAGPEAAEAICLGEHALSSLDVADAVGVRRLAQLGWTEPRGFWKGGRFNPA